MRKEPTEPPSLGGRPAHDPTDESRRMVEAMSAFGIRQAEMARVIGISCPTLRRAYRDELHVGAAKVEAKLVGNLLRLAGGSDGTALRAIMFSLRLERGVP